MKLIYVASPYAGDIENNVAFAKSACEYVMEQGHAFFAPHLYYTQFLDDSKPAQREIGLEMGIETLKRCDELWLFGDTISHGMRKELEFAKKQNIPTFHVRDEEMEYFIGETYQKVQSEVLMC